MALIAFTFRDLPGQPLTQSKLVSYLIAVALLALVASMVLYFHHFHKAIDVLGDLASRLAFADLDHDDLQVPAVYWKSRAVRWGVASAMFYSGCGLYTLALALYVAGVA